MEEWKVIPRFSKYAVSNLGRVRSLDASIRFVHRNGKEYFRLRKGRILKLQIDSKGYPTCPIYKKTRRVHRLVCEAFLDNYSEELQVDHINGVRNDNRLENLKMATAKENINNPITSVYYKTRARDNKGRFL